MKIVLGHKLGMTQIWSDKGRLIGATVIFVEPNTVLKTEKRTQLVTETEGKTNKPQQKIASTIGSKRGIWIKEVSALETDQATVDVAQFAVGEKVAISGVTKGKGFSGTIKRHNFHRGPVSHGSDNVRRPGSIGAQRPQRVPKGQKMAGRMGGANLTVRGNKVLAVNETEKLLIVSGPVPGAKRGRVIVKGI